MNIKNLKLIYLFNVILNINTTTNINSKKLKSIKNLKKAIEIKFDSIKEIINKIFQDRYIEMNNIQNKTLEDLLLTYIQKIPNLNKLSSEEKNKFFKAIKEIIQSIKYNDNFIQIKELIDNNTILYNILYFIYLLLQNKETNDMLKDIINLLEDDINKIRDIKNEINFLTILKTIPKQNVFEIEKKIEELLNLLNIEKTQLKKKIEKILLDNMSKLINILEKDTISKNTYIMNGKVKITFSNMMNIMKKYQNKMLLNSLVLIIENFVLNGL